NDDVALRTVRPPAFAVPVGLDPEAHAGGKRDLQNPALSERAGGDDDFAKALVCAVAAHDGFGIFRDHGDGVFDAHAGVAGIVEEFQVEAGVHVNAGNTPRTNGNFVAIGIAVRAGSHGFH